MSIQQQEVLPVNEEDVSVYDESSSLRSKISYLTELQEVNDEIEKDEDVLDQCWKDPNSWEGYDKSVYKNCNDPRLWVPHRLCSSSGNSFNIGRNTTAANQLKSRMAMNKGRRETIVKILKTQFHQDVDKIHLPSTLPQCQERLQSVDMTLSQMDLHLQVMWQDANSWIKRPFFGDFYACPDDYRSSVPKQGGGSTNKTQHNWSYCSTLYAYRFRHTHKNLLSEKEMLKKEIAKMEKFLAENPA